MSPVKVGVVSTVSSESCVPAPAMSPVKVGSKRSSDETPSGRFRHQQNRKTDPAIQAGNIASSQVDVSPEEPPSVTRTTTASSVEASLDGPPPVSRTAIERTILVRHSETSRVYSHVYPVYHMTHRLRIRLIEIEGKQWWCVECDCDYFICHKCPCRHIYCYIERKPIVSDFYPEATKLYANFYAEPGREDYTEYMDNVR